jgi:hypothetical protein
LLFRDTAVSISEITCCNDFVLSLETFVPSYPPTPFTYNAFVEVLSVVFFFEINSRAFRLPFDKDPAPIENTVLN